MADPIDVVMQFIQCINEKDLEGIYNLMTDNHHFIDSSGKVFQGKDMMIQNWKSYFEWFPNYFIEIETCFTEGGLIGLFGTASASYHGSDKNENQWSLPCAWRVSIEGNQISYWQVYVDNKKIYSIMEGYSS